MSTATGDTVGAATGQAGPEADPTGPTATGAAPRRRWYRAWFRRRQRPTTRIPGRRRRQLARLGRVDGAAGLPDPDASFVTTDARRALRNQLNADRAALWEAFHTEQTERDVELADVDGRLTAARAELAQAEAALGRVGPRDQVVGAAQAGRGETAHGRPADLVARRRGRRHDREAAAATARRDAARGVVRELERRRETLGERSAGRRNETVTHEHRLIGVHLTERAIYDRSLVSSHPDRDEVGPLLDRTPPELSQWARAALAAEATR